MILVGYVSCFLYCSRVDAVRLAGSGVNYQGRLEVYYDGEWGTVCDDDFDDNDATVACYMLGFGYVYFIISARCNIYISHLCYDVSVRLSVTEVHWRIIANLGFILRSHFTAHCGRHAAGGRRAARRAAWGGSSRAMLASARVSCS